jgi:hypothetical protein
VEPVPVEHVEEVEDIEDVGRTGARFGQVSARQPKWSATAEPAAPQPSGWLEPDVGQEVEPDRIDPANPPLESPLASESGVLVRPYARTGGRTRPARDLALEALIRTRSSAVTPTHLLSRERQAIITLCLQPRSVAEVSALLSLPLGVARVLLGDLAEAGVVEVHRSGSGDDAPDLGLMQRVLAGLRRL